MALVLNSPSFEDGQVIPRTFTGEGEDRSPQLSWSYVPDGTREFVLICEDPDAPQPEPFVHWIAYNISPSVTQLPEGLPARRDIEFPVRLHQGQNSSGNIGYGGPMPPVGHGPHRYIFMLYALNTELGVPPGASKEELLKAMQGHVIDQARLTGIYERRKKLRKTA